MFMEEPMISRLRYSHYVLALLWAAAVLRFVDLQILAVLLEPIKAEFQLTDTQLALLGGLAFALFYGILGIPVAWLAERYSRRSIVAFAVMVWSLMTMLCGQASSFTGLFLARMGVGIGEAGAYPPTVSLLADYFPKNLRGRACAILASAIPIGVLVGFLVGGTLAARYGWRLSLQVVGLPGVLLGLLIMATVREPGRGSMGDAVITATNGFWPGSIQLWRRPGYALLVAASCLFTMGATGSGLWMATYFMRNHGLSGPATGLWMAALYGGGGFIGCLTGGWLGQRFDQQGTGFAYARVCQYSLTALLPLLPFVLLSASTSLALACLLGVTLLMHMNVGPVLTLVQLLGGSHQKALAHAWLLLVSNLVALPLGPLMVGMASDWLTPLLGSRSLGLAILVLLLLCWPLSATLFAALGSRLGRDLKIQGGRKLPDAGSQDQGMVNAYLKEF